MTQVACPNCGASLEWGPQSPYRPFCSKRCKLIDLGAWIDGSNSIPGSELDESALDQLDLDGRPANE